MDKTELMDRVGDLYNYVQAVRIQLDQIDSAIERLKNDVALKTPASAIVPCENECGNSAKPLARHQYGETMLKHPKSKQVKRKTKRTTADKWFSLYIRLRDIVTGEYCRCVTCNKPIHWRYEAECGHYATREKPMTRFHEQNCHAQCKACNGYRSGEQTKHGFAIDRMYGSGKAEELINLSEIRGQKIHGSVTLKEIATEYRLKSKELAKIRGITI